MAGKYDDMSFKKAFAAARKAQGAGKVFTWKGKRYTTNTKEDEAKKKVTKPKPRPKSGAAKKTVKPKKRPGSGEPPVAKPGELAIKKVTTTFINKGGNTRPLKIPATVTNKIKKINSDIKKISIGEREAASKRLENTKKKLAELRNKKVDKNPGSKIDEILDSLTKLGLYVKDLSKGGGVPGVRKRRNKKPTVKFGSGGR
tara:strand:- start:255 stop:854 length:600 start_codon:yes stop_codon:yes gene_type:complete